jgi:hypothetical protein
MAYADEVLADSPLAYWKLNDASGATAADSSGNSRPATYVNTPEAYNQAPILAGTSNNVSFESGGTDYLTIADAAWQSGMGALSLEQVIRPETVLGAGAWHQWFAKTNGGTYSFWSGCVNDGGTHKLGFAVASASAANLGYVWSRAGAPSTVNGEHIVFTWNGGSTAASFKCYINGVDQGTPTVFESAGSLGTTIWDSANPTTWGTWNGGDLYDGDVSDLAIYSTALSQGRVTAHYNAAAAAAGITRTLGQPSESDTATALTKRKSKAVGQPSESDTATALTKRKSKAVGQPSESDTATALTKRKSKAVGQPSETDSAGSITETGAIQRTLGQPSESDTATALTKRKSKAVGQPSESDTATALTKRKSKAVGQPVEADSARGISAPLGYSQSLTRPFVVELDGGTLFGPDLTPELTLLPDSGLWPVGAAEGPFVVELDEPLFTVTLDEPLFTVTLDEPLFTAALDAAEATVTLDEAEYTVEIEDLVPLP